METLKTRVKITAKDICTHCGLGTNKNEFLITKNQLFKDGKILICAKCQDKLIFEEDGVATPKAQIWNKVNKMCQWADIPFVLEEWEKIRKNGKNNFFLRYNLLFRGKAFAQIDWADYNEEYLKLEERKLLGDEVPLVREARRKKLYEKWGEQSDEDYTSLENLFNDIINTQNITTGTQIDQIKKICKTSLMIDKRLRENLPYKDFLDSYDKLVKIADLSPKNSKNGSDFDSVGELFVYLEKLGWLNRFYDGAIRDEVDETMKNIQSWTRRLWTHEPSAADEVEARIKMLKELKEMENKYSDSETDFDAFDFDSYENVALDVLKSEDFEVDV